MFFGQSAWASHGLFAQVERLAGTLAQHRAVNEVPVTHADRGGAVNCLAGRRRTSGSQSGASSQAVLGLSTTAGLPHRRRTRGPFVQRSSSALSHYCLSRLAAKKRVISQAMRRMMRTVAWAAICCVVVVVATPLDRIEAQAKARDTLQAALDGMAAEHIASSFDLGDPLNSDPRTHRPVHLSSSSHPDQPLLGDLGESLGEASGAGLKAQAGTRTGESAAVVPTAAQLIAARPVAQKEADNMRATLLKPPGCRPTALEVSQYSRIRTICASGFPKLQTPITMKIAEARLVEISDQAQTFTVEVAREFQWFDINATSQPLDLLWQAQTYIAYSETVKVDHLSPTEVQVEDGQIKSKDFMRVTFATTSWDYSYFPFESHKLRLVMQTKELTDMLEPLTIAADSSVFSAEVHGWSVTKPMQVQYSTKGSSFGPEGVWGSSQEVELTVEVSRTWDYGIVRGTLQPLCAKVLSSHTSSCVCARSAFAIFPVCSSGLRWLLHGHHRTDVSLTSPSL